MNGYIINPAWFYWVNVADGIRIVVIVGMILSLSAFLVSAIIMFVEDDDDLLKPTRFGLIFSIFFVLGAVFVPSKETLIEMQIAKYATWENAEWTVDAIKDAVDYIVNAIGSLK